MKQKSQDIENNAENCADVTCTYMAPNGIIASTPFSFCLASKLLDNLTPISKDWLDLSLNEKGSCVSQMETETLPPNQTGHLFHLALSVCIRNSMHLHDGF